MSMMSPNEGALSNITYCGVRYFVRSQLSSGTALLSWSHPGPSLVSDRNALPTAVKWYDSADEIRTGHETLSYGTLIGRGLPLFHNHKTLDRL
jgi:hypothetical protein